MKYGKKAKHEKMADEFIESPEKMTDKQKKAFDRIAKRHGLEVENAIVS